MTDRNVDGLDGNEIIDRKLNSVFTEKAVDQARRQAATAAYNGLQAVWELNPEPLVRAIIGAMMLMEHSGPEEIDPDTAVRGLDNMGHELLRLPESDRSAFLALLERLAASAADEPTARFIRSVPFSLGMSMEA